MPYVAADSFTTIARVEALVGIGVFSDAPTATKPTKQEVLDRMAQQAARIQAVLTRYAYVGTPPSGVYPLIVSAEPGATVARLADEANAFLAAAYALDMKTLGDTDRKRYDALLAAAYAIIGNPNDCDCPKGTLVEFLENVGGRSRAAVSTPEYLNSSLLHFDTMQT